MSNTENTVIWSEVEIPSDLYPIMDFTTLLEQIDNGELDKIFAFGLEYIELENWKPTIGVLLSKVRVGGIITFRITNLGHVLKAILSRNYEPDTYNKYLWDGKESGMTCDRFKEIIERFGKIQEIKMEGIHYFITVERQS